MLLVDKIALAQSFLHKELGSDWNDLCRTLYEQRVLHAMLNFSDSLKNSKETAQSSVTDAEKR